MRWVWQEDHRAVNVTEFTSGDGATFLDALLECSDFDCMVNLIKSAFNTVATVAGVPQRPLIPGPSKAKPQHCATGVTRSVHERNPVLNMQHARMIKGK